MAKNRENGGGKRPVETEQGETVVGREDVRREISETKEMARITPRQEADDFAKGAYENVANISSERRTELLIALMEQHFTDQANVAAIGLSEDFRKAEASDPRLRFINDTLLGELARARGQRLVDSAAMDEAVRTARAKLAEQRKTSAWQRMKNVFVSEGTEDTAIIQAHQKLLTEITGLETERTRLAGEVSSLEHNKMALTEKMAKEAQAITEKAHANAQEIISTAGQKMERLESKLAELRREVDQLEKYKNKLLEDPKVVAVRSYEVLNQKEFDLEQSGLRSRIEKIEQYEFSSSLMEDLLGVITYIEGCVNAEALFEELINWLDKVLENKKLRAIDVNDLKRLLVLVMRKDVTMGSFKECVVEMDKPVKAVLYNNFDSTAATRINHDRIVNMIAQVEKQKKQQK